MLTGGPFRTLENGGDMTKQQGRRASIDRRMSGAAEPTLARAEVVTVEQSSDGSLSAPATRPTRFPLDVVYQAARMYYLEEATQIEIANRLHVSRPTVSRLISEARASGLVRIEVIDPFEDETVVLADALTTALGVGAVYLAAVSNESTLGADLSAPVARAIAGMHLGADDALLISSGHTVYSVVRAGFPALPGVVLAPTVGGMTESMSWFQTNEITRIAAERAGAVPIFLFAQAVPSVAMRASLDEDPSFQQVVDLWGRAKGALLGIGAPTATRNELSRGIPVDDVFDDAVGDVCLNFFDAGGAAIEFPGSERMVRTSRETLAHLPHAVGMAVGAAKVPSIIGAVRGGLINELVTDAATARDLLKALAAE